VRHVNKVGYAAQLQRGIAVRIPRPFILLLSFCLLTLPALNSAAIADDTAPVKVTLQAAIVQGAKALKDDIKWSIAPLSKDGPVVGPGSGHLH
jgi:hypothetical protein